MHASGPEIQPLRNESDPESSYSECIFPFVFDNETFHECTDYDEPSGKLW
jgi:hypothetical protein